MSISLHTDRLYLRPPELADSERITSLLEPIIIINLAVVPSNYRPQDAIDWIESCRKNLVNETAYNLLIDEPAAGIIGTVGVRQKAAHHSTLGYWIGAAYWGNGYATEAASALIARLVQTQPVNKISANHFLDSPASGRVLEKLGLRPAEIIMQSSLARGGDHPAMSYVWQPVDAKNSPPPANLM